MLHAGEQAAPVRPHRYHRCAVCSAGGDGGPREHDYLERWCGGRTLPWHRADLGFFGAHALSRCARVTRMDSCHPLLATHFLIEKQVEARRFMCGWPLPGKRKCNVPHRSRLQSCVRPVQAVQRDCCLWALQTVCKTDNGCRSRSSQRARESVLSRVYPSILRA